MIWQIHSTSLKSHTQTQLIKGENHSLRQLKSLQTVKQPLIHDNRQYNRMTMMNLLTILLLFLLLGCQLYATITPMLTKAQERQESNTKESTILTYVLNFCILLLIIVNIVSIIF